MSDHSEDPTELHDLIYRALERNGVISNIRAQLRSSVYTVIDSESKKLSTPNDGLSFAQELLTTNKTNQIALTIVRDFLKKFKLFYTLSLLDRELSLDQVDLLPQDVINDDPILEFLIKNNNSEEKDQDQEKDDRVEEKPILSTLIDEHKKLQKENAQTHELLTKMKHHPNTSSINGDSGINESSKRGLNFNNNLMNQRTTSRLDSERPKKNFYGKQSKNDLLPNPNSYIRNELVVSPPNNSTKRIAATRITPLGEISTTVYSDYPVQNSAFSSAFLPNLKNTTSIDTNGIQKPKSTSLLKQTINLHKKQNLLNYLATIPSMNHLNQQVKKAYIENIYSESKHLEELKENLLEIILNDCQKIAKDENDWRRH